VAGEPVCWISVGACGDSVMTGVMTGGVEFETSILYQWEVALCHAASCQEATDTRQLSYSTSETLLSREDAFGAIVRQECGVHWALQAVT